MRVLAATLVLSATSSRSLAQDLEPETVVRAARSSEAATTSPALRATVTGEELARTNERSLPRALGKAAGIWIQETNLGGGAPVINGLLGNRIVIVIDGVRMNDSTTRLGPNQSLNSIPPEIVERIDVVHGPGSVLYGSDAVGGAILIWTRSRAPAPLDPAARDLRAEVGADYHSAADGGRGYLGVSGASEVDGWLASGALEDWGSLRSGGGEEWPTSYSGGDAFASWARDLGAGRSLRLTGMVSQQEDVPRTDRLVTGFGQTQPANDKWNYSLQDRRRWIAAYTDAGQGGFADRFDLRVSLRTYKEEREILGNGSSTQSNERDETLTTGIGLDWRKLVASEHLLTWGLDFDHDLVDSTAADVDINTGTSTPSDGAFAPNANYTSTGVFVQDEILCFQPFDVTAGLRYSWFGFGFDDFASAGTGGHESGSFSALTSSLAVARDLAPGTRLTGVLAQGFRAPNLEDLANNSSFAGGTELANPDLEPEKSLTAQLALDLQSERWNSSISLYATWIDDLIGRQLISAGGPSSGDETWMRDNAGEAWILGTNLAGRIRLGGPLSPWASEAGLSFVWGQQYDDTVDPNTNTQPYYDVPFRRIPPLSGRASMIWDGLSEWDRLDEAALSFVFADEQERLNPEDETDPRIDPNGTAGWARLDLDFTGLLSRPDDRALAQWRLGLHNLLDMSYRVHSSGLDAPGFGVVVGMTVTL